MKYLAVLLLPLAISAPTVQDNHQGQAPKHLSTSQRIFIPSSLSEGLSKLSGLTWKTAGEIVESFEDQDAADVVSEDKTIWQLLKDDPVNFSKLIKVVEFVGDEPLKYLDGDKPITFFAPNNEALTPPGHGPGHHGDHGHHEYDLAELMSNPSLASISALLENEPSLMITSDDDGDDDDDDDEKKRRRELFRKLAKKVLQYHGLSEALSAADISERSTLASALWASDGSYGGLQRRIKVKKTLIPPSINLNFYAKIVDTDNKAKNGYLHTIAAPLIPPPSIFESTYIFPDFYSTFTSAVQNLHGRHWLDWEYNFHRHHDHDVDDDDDHKKKALDDGLAAYAQDLIHELFSKKEEEAKFIGTPLATMFVPTNSAFAVLPPRLKFFLFSPFGRRALTKILAYHYIYDALILTEFQHFGKDYPLPEHKDEFVAPHVVESVDGEDLAQTIKVTNSINETLSLYIEKKKVLPVKVILKVNGIETLENDVHATGATKVILKVNGIETLENDVPARNGAFHVSHSSTCMTPSQLTDDEFQPIGLILVPPHHHHDEDGVDVSSTDSWANWEE
ncbi:hypothetical protein BD324DRAFT_634413 [Kockovaella imperatae]|uniref:FAS1 domain-containing protein n=1 Tax=Kockovaella imperatae TaxID=4999 RepID=A0A1Y1UAU2_9TREE|nr:hypothetical protein BD324DRAFT_634413 [Kockovaella imperatae]ORX34664.1 hypothetical protein BD324DRAFT_634413 [Kockovaella imperatae]